MLADNTDERCRTIAFELLLVYVCVGAVVYAFFTLTIKYMRRRLKKAARRQEGGQTTSFPLRNLLEVCDGDHDPEAFAKIYQKWREDEISVGDKIHDFLTFHKVTSDVFTARDVCLRLYEAEKELNGGNVERTDIFFFVHLASNEVTDFFYSNVYRGFLVRLKMFLQNVFPCINVQCLEHAVALKKLLIAIKYAVKVALHYVDVVKDLLVMCSLLDYVTDSEGNLMWTDYHAFAVTMAAVMLTSILLSEVSNALVIASHPILKGGNSIALNLLGSFFGPFFGALSKLFSEMQPS